MRPPAPGGQINYIGMTVGELQARVAQGDPQAQRVLDELTQGGTPPNARAYQESATSIEGSPVKQDRGNVRALFEWAKDNLMPTKQDAPPESPSLTSPPQTAPGPLELFNKTLDRAATQVGISNDPNDDNALSWDPGLPKPQMPGGSPASRGPQIPVTKAKVNAPPAPPKQAWQTSAAMTGEPAPKITPPPSKEDVKTMEGLFGKDKVEGWTDVMRFGLELMKSGEAKPGSVVGPSFLGAVGEAGASSLDRMASRKIKRAKLAARKEEKDLDRAVKLMDVEETAKLRRETAATKAEYQKLGYSIDLQNSLMKTHEQERREIGDMKEGMDFLSMEPEQQAVKVKEIRDKWSQIRGAKLSGDGPRRPETAQEIRSRNLEAVKARVGAMRPSQGQ